MIRARTNASCVLEENDWSGRDKGPGVHASPAYKRTSRWWLHFWVTLGDPVGQVYLVHFGSLDGPEWERGRL